MITNNSLFRHDSVANGCFCKKRRKNYIAITKKDYKLVKKYSK